jgi:futalosine hydrolase
MVNTAMHLAQLFTQHHYDLAMNIGIAGSFDPDIAIGDVVQVSEDRIAWFGAEDHHAFIAAQDMGLCKIPEVVFTPSAFCAELPSAKAITVNLAHGNEASILKTMKVYGPQVESMEGAAFFRVCKHFNVKAMQVRAISNRVEPRDRKAWDIPLALHNLAIAVTQILEELDNGD